MSDQFPAPTGQRPVRTDGRPRRSIVLTSTGAAEDAVAALDVLARLRRESEVELLVAYSESDELNAESEGGLRTAYPQVRFVRLPRNMSMADVRQAALDRCDGDIVRFVDAGSPVDQSGIDALIQLDSGTDGSVDPR